MPWKKSTLIHARAHAIDTSAKTSRGVTAVQVFPIRRRLPVFAKRECIGKTSAQSCFFKSTQIRFLRLQLMVSIHWARIFPRCVDCLPSRLSGLSLPSAGEWQIAERMHVSAESDIDQWCRTFIANPCPAA